ncbi:hypothetical protein LTR85_005049 [Meristemomyces frigidus]|nr:hypothetical protein LTR85_005049 [Meristemomyces frigidus]
MAERVCSRDASTVTRRPSFRKTLREHEATLPPEYLEALEAKRKQLDESIHKYIAAKEREYKQYEKDLRQQAKSSSASPASVAQLDGPVDSNASLGAMKRRTSSESHPEMAANSQLFTTQPSSAVDALMASDLRREPVSQAAEDEQRPAMAGPTDRRTNGEREKDFIGLFTPPFLPAIDNKSGRQLERADSAPGAVETVGRVGADSEELDLRKSGSDSAMQAKAKRPAHLEVGRRTSSSGSSADGRLASAMKSPTHNLSVRSRKKRVSLAVGDSIVAPSDNVPLALDHHSTPSHSRTRSPATEREQIVANEPMTSTMDFASASSPAAMSSAERVEQIMNAGPASASEPNKGLPVAERRPAAPAMPAMPAQTSSAGSSPRTQSTIDPDGDLFDLEEESDLPPQQSESDELESPAESEEDIMPGIAGRIEHGTDRSERTEVHMDSPGLKAGEHYQYDPEGGLIPESVGAPAPVVVEEDANEHAVHLEFGPAFSASSQQPTKPGFRRPSVVSDPVFRGPDYQTVEAQAANEEVYGSSYSRPTSKGSFTAGSLGESYMAKHAEGMMKLRMAKQQQDVRT